MRWRRRLLRRQRRALDVVALKFFEGRDPFTLRALVNGRVVNETELWNRRTSKRRPRPIQVRVSGSTMVVEARSMSARDREVAEFVAFAIADRLAHDCEILPDGYRFVLKEADRG